LSDRFIVQLAVVVCASLGVTLGATGCLSGDDTSANGTTINLDAGTPETSAPVLDASGVVDGAPPPVDAAPPLRDSAPPIDSSTPPDAGASSSQLGLVGGGTLSRSPNYVLIGSTGPATAPVLRSPKYQVVGGMAASAK
jgi:hypothetical protein